MFIWKLYVVWQWAHLYKGCVLRLQLKKHARNIRTEAHTMHGCVSKELICASQICKIPPHTATMLHIYWIVSHLYLLSSRACERVCVWIRNLLYHMADCSHGFGACMQICWCRQQTSIRRCSHFVHLKFMPIAKYDQICTWTFFEPSESVVMRKDRARAYKIILLKFLAQTRWEKTI